jgi:hypothetical protein
MTQLPRLQLLEERHLDRGSPGQLRKQTRRPPAAQESKDGLLAELIRPRFAP